MSEAGFREVSVREGYALWAASYDQEKNGLIFVEERQVDRLLAQLSFTRVLDVGTGTGRHALKLARRGASVTALDQSPEMLAVARQAAQREVLPIDFHLLSLDDGLPFEAEQFDLLICALTLSHVLDLAPALQEFARPPTTRGSSPTLDLLLQAVFVFATSSRPNTVIACLRNTNFCTLPLAVRG